MRGIGAPLQLAQPGLQLLRLQRLPTGLQKPAERLSLIQQQLPSASRPKDLLLGLRDPSSVMDGWQLDVDGSRLPWWA